MACYHDLARTGSEWIGLIPAHWSLKKLKFVATYKNSNVDKHSVDGETQVRLCNYTDVYYNERLSADLPLMVATASDKEIRDFSLCPDEIIITKDSEDAEDIGIPAIVSDYMDGVVCGYHLTIIRAGRVLFPEFLFRVLQAEVSRRQFQISASGVTRYGLGQGAIGNLQVPVPSPGEQRTIAAFLDHETARIDRLIEKQQRLIELLEEKRHAVISHAVTKGLDPDAQMKDGGVEWMGVIPEHWAVARLMHLTPTSRQIMYGIVLPGPHFDGGVPIIKGGDVKWHRLRVDCLNRTDPEIEANYVRSRVRAGDLVYAIRGGIGDVEIVPQDVEGSNLTQDAARISPRKGVDSRWLRYALSAQGVAAQLKAGAVGATISGINIRDLKRARIPFPPAEERAAIADHLDAVSAKIGRLLSTTREAIERMREHRSALISAAVTGQIDVRGWQPDAPESEPPVLQAAEEPASYG